MEQENPYVFLNVLFQTDLCFWDLQSVGQHRAMPFLHAFELPYIYLARLDPPRILTDALLSSWSANTLVPSLSIWRRELYKYIPCEFQPAKTNAKAVLSVDYRLPSAFYGTMAFGVFFFEMCMASKLESAVNPSFSLSLSPT